MAYIYRIAILYMLYTVYCVTSYNQNVLPFMCMYLSAQVASDSEIIKTEIVYMNPCLLPITVIMTCNVLQPTYMRTQEYFMERLIKNILYSHFTHIICLEN